MFAGKGEIQNRQKSFLAHFKCSEKENIETQNNGVWSGQFIFRLQTDKRKQIDQKIRTLLWVLHCKHYSSYVGNYFYKIQLREKFNNNLLQVFKFFKFQKTKKTWSKTFQTAILVIVFCNFKMS